MMKRPHHTRPASTQRTAPTRRALCALVCVLASCGDLPSEHIDPTPQTAETSHNETSHTSGGTTHTHGSTSTEPATTDILDGSRYFEHLTPWEDQHNPNEDAPYCNPDTFVAPPPSNEPLPEGCDPNTDPSTPCIVDHSACSAPYAYDIVYNGPSEHSCIPEHISSSTPDARSWDCETKPEPYGSFQVASEWLQERIDQERFTPNAVFDAPSDLYTDHLNTRGLLTTRLLTLNEGHIQAIYYSYNEDDQLSAWTSQDWYRDSTGAYYEDPMFFTGQVDKHGTLRHWRGFDGSHTACTIHFNAQGVRAREECVDDVHIPSYTSLKIYDCRGLATFSYREPTLEGSFTRDISWWEYDDYGRLRDYGQADFDRYEHYTATYAQNPAQPIEAPPCQ